jgi:hypothetical protein
VSKTYGDGFFLELGLEGHGVDIGPRGLFGLFGLALDPLVVEGQYFLDASNFVGEGIVGGICQLALESLDGTSFLEILVGDVVHFNGRYLEFERR